MTLSDQKEVINLKAHCTTQLNVNTDPPYKLFAHVQMRLFLVLNGLICLYRRY